MQLVDKLFRDKLRRPFYSSPADWCRENVRLPPEAGAARGWFQPTRFQSELMDILDARNGPRRVFLMKSARIGYSECIKAYTLYLLAERHRHVTWYLPTDPDARVFAKTGMAPMLRDSPPCKAMQDLAVESGDGREARTATLKVLAGKILRILGAQTPGRFRGITSDVVVLDELDDYPALDEGDVVSLAARATRNSPWRKLIAGSTPTNKNTSQIARQMDGCDLILDWKLECPECGHRHAPRWKDIQFAKEGTADERASSAAMLCPECGCLWTHDRMDGGGFDIPDKWPARVGLRINALSSPFVPWSELVREWLAAQGNILSLQVFTNHVLGECWIDSDDMVMDSTDIQVEDLSAPEGVLTVIAAVDVQSSEGGWLSVLVVGFGLGEEAWLLERRTFYGAVDSVDAHAWTQLREWLAGRPRWNGLEIEAVAVDSGHETAVVYDVCPTLPARRVLPFKGIGGWDRPAVKHPPSKVRTTSGGALRLWNLGTDQSKVRIASRLKAGGVHLVDTLPTEVHQELTSEVLTVRTRGGKRTRQWVLKAGRKRNEALDCLAMAWASLHVLRPPWLRSRESMDAARQWSKSIRDDRAKKAEDDETSMPEESYGDYVKRIRKRQTTQRRRTWL